MMAAARAVTAPVAGPRRAPQARVMAVRGDQDREEQAADHGDRHGGGGAEGDHRVGDGLQGEDGGGDAEACHDGAEDAEAEGAVAPAG
ncbi:hypothetical protein AFR_09950 [Actinoplanes friuliensis DSM 7358]|uniref:Uncharacterized protein n=1 Tax=Actinoplanes friuliensis DSM 7358 TaxID=1246995 RepID=U5VTT2_9ACTN|nr:hypothetical protein AFR_09950 [Actinoplanes friuliensis DSM 7358]